MSNIMKSDKIKITLKVKGQKSKQTKSTFVFPSLPEEINVKSNAKYQTYDMIHNGTLQIPVGTNVETISWTGIFFGENLKKHNLLQKWIKPKECEKVLMEWLTNGTVLNLIVSQTSINYDVTISSFERTQMGAYGNISYNINFTRYRPLKIYDASELNLKAPQLELEERPTPPPSPSQTYSVIKGDCLWKIATKFYGTGTRWTEIYSANKDAIEETANRYRKGKGSDNGHWIYPGQILMIP